MQNQKSNRERNRPITSAFEENIKALSNELPFYLDKTREIPSKVFSGPSVYFHKRAIDEAKRKIGEDFLGERHLEMIYAVLPAWGMHRMGETLTKMVDYEKFKKQIMNQEKVIKAMKQKYEDKTIVDVSDEDVKNIVKLMFDIRVSESHSQLVSSSKTLHHILPDIVPPIDRAYSLKFMGRTISYQIKNFDQKTEKEKNDALDKKIAKEISVAIEYMEMMKEFMNDKNRLSKMKQYLKDDFNTSLPKLFDNLVVAFVKRNFPKLEKKNKS